MKSKSRVPFREEDEDSSKSCGFDDRPDALSFRTAQYQSTEMKRIVALAEVEVEQEDIVCDYEAKDVFPDWCLKNANWTRTVMHEEALTVS
ncbi:hypothetical protein B484DRAFT_390563, partial [Ochromonadaceae sp. CCMP2298]